MENMTRNEILAVAIQAAKDSKLNFDAKTSEGLRNAFVELNGGSTKIDPKTFYRGNELFALVQELIPVIIDERLTNSENPLLKLVDYRNIAAGDEIEFVANGDANFVVSAVANGVQGIRRQRIAGGQTFKISLEAKAVRVYENLGRLLAGRIDFNKFVDGVGAAYEKYVLDQIYQALKGITTNTYNLDATYVKTGSYTAEGLLELIDHVEAANGQKATIFGTKAALRKLGADITASAEQNADLYNKGYIGKFFGTDVVGIEQMHKPGTNDFALPADALWVVASDDKFIKVVNGGDGILLEGDPAKNADLTQEYFFAQNFGIGVVCAAKIGYWNSLT